MQKVMAHMRQKQKGVTWEEGDQQEDKGTQSGVGQEQRILMQL